MRKKENRQLTNQNRIQQNDKDFFVGRISSTS